jgi:hypothetical protein
MSQLLFGAGVLWGTPLTDATGASIAVPSPVQFGVLQDVSVDIQFDAKTLYGQNQFPVAVGRGKGKIDGKAKHAQINGMLLNSLFFGQTLTNGMISDVYDTNGVVVPATPFQVTPTVPNSGSFLANLGVRDASGVPMTRVISSPGTGQYSVSAGGQYTFNSADAGKTVYINFQYTASSTLAKKSTVLNLPMGYAPSFQVDLMIPYNNKTLHFTLHSCQGSKFSIATKQDDFVIPEFDFSAFATDDGRVLTWGLSE